MRFKIQKREFIPKQCNGLGDVVAMVAEPIKKNLVAVMPAKLAQMIGNCNCNKRREALNQLVAFTSGSAV